MSRAMQYRNLLGWAIAVFTFITGSVAHADLIVTPTVTSAAGMFHYDYTIANVFPSEDVALVDVNVLPMDTTLTNLFAPPGFQNIYDIGLGIVSFLPTLGSPDLFEVGTTKSGFGFDSAYAPANSTFSALTLSGIILVGPTQAPVGVSVPEPDLIILLMAGISALAGFRAYTSMRHR